MNRPKHYCAYPGGCPVVLKGSRREEYCTEHTCTAFSVSYGQCVQVLGHQNKHINGENEEWG
jgi:hypothetical protein